MRAERSEVAVNDNEPEDLLPFTVPLATEEEDAEGAGDGMRREDLSDPSLAPLLRKRPSSEATAATTPAAQPEEPARNGDANSSDATGPSALPSASVLSPRKLERLRLQWAPIVKPHAPSAPTTRRRRRANSARRRKSRSEDLTSQAAQLTRSLSRAPGVRRSDSQRSFTRRTFKRK